MFKTIKVLVVDDSAFMRKAISEIINVHKDMEVIGTARDGVEAFEMAKKLTPDIITLDVEMPKKNGLEALKEIKKYTLCEVIMLSSLTIEGSQITIECLKEGAFDFVQKPSGAISLNIDTVSNDIADKIRYANKNKTKNSKTKIVINDNKVKDEKPRETQIKKHNKSINAIVLGASTGGPRVLYDILSSIPQDLNVPIFVVQHMPKGFTKAFADRLNKNCKMKVVEAEDKQKILPNTIYIAPGGYHMIIKSKDRISLEDTNTLHGVKPAVDKLFLSAANVFKDSLLGCICTGMGRDGADGIKAIKLSGGFTIAQDEDTSIVYGMPKVAYETNCIDVVLPYYKISHEIVKQVKRK